MNLAMLWYILIALLFTGYFILEGYDFGIGILLPFLARDDQERRLFLNAMGPFWLGNETWLVAAVGAMFGAFPRWYGTFLSSLYLLIVALLISFMLRGAGVEFRSHQESKRWRSFWDWIVFVGSALPCLIWGMIAAAVFQGLPLDAHMRNNGTFWQLFTPLGWLWGLTLMALLTLHGALFLNLRIEATTSSVTHRTHQIARRLWLPTIILILMLTIAGAFSSSIIRHLLLMPWSAASGLLVLLALIMAGFLIRLQLWSGAILMTSLAIACAALALSLALFPNVLPSSLNPAWNLTIENTVADPSTLSILTWCGLIILPIVITYQSIGYWVFRQRLHAQSTLHY